METSFDTIAESYDSDFTYSEIGKKQRKHVWNYLKSQFHKESLSILELNCGTGEDALFLSELGHQVMATDASSKMVAIAQSKCKTEKGDVLFQVQQTAFSKVSSTFQGKQFDCIFSNFGGLNCANPQELQQLSLTLQQLLPVGGRVLLVIMPRFCIWETVYYLFKLQFSKAFRRLSRKKQIAQLDEGTVPIWYYSPKDIIKVFGSNFTTRHVQPVGLTLPPSYLEKYFSKNRKQLQFLDYIESKLGVFAVFAWLADHYLIDLEKTK